MSSFPYLLYHIISHQLLFGKQYENDATILWTEAEVKFSNLKMTTFLLILLISVSLTGAGRLQKSDPVFERIITEISDVTNGVPVNYSYNDTSRYLPRGGLPSVPGCPKNVDGRPWVYYSEDSSSPSSTSVKSQPQPTKCFLAGEQGPCDPGQVIFIERGNPYGYCNCDCFEGDNRNDRSREYFCKKEWAHPVKPVFYARIKKCYKLYEQGPCDDNEWLVEMTSTEKHLYSYSRLTKCEKRRCPFGQEASFYQTLDSDEYIFQCDYPSNCEDCLEIESVAKEIKTDSCQEPDNMMYSQLLKKCVSKFFSFSF